MVLRRHSRPNAAQVRLGLGMKPGAAAVATWRSQASVDRSGAASTTRSPWAWALWSGLAGGLFSVLGFAPAAWLAHGLAVATENRVLLADAQGSIWSGQARMVLTGGAGSRDALALPGPLRWTLAPGWSGLRLGLQADCCMNQPLAVQLSAGFDGFLAQLSDQDSHWPAQLLVGLGTPWNTLSPEGQLQFRPRAVRLQWAAGRLTLDGQLEVQALDMASRLSTLRPLGDYQLQLGGGAVPSLTLRTLKGDLQLTGQGQWVGGRLRFQGEATAVEGREAALSNLLNLLGRRQGPKSLISVG
jgi:general secretion pathway protein N